MSLRLHPRHGLLARVHARLGVEYALVGVVIAFLAAGCSGPRASSRQVSTTRSDDIVLVHSPRRVAVECRQVAAEVGYAVPCPSLLPAASSPIVPVAGPMVGSSEAKWFLHSGEVPGLGDWVFSDVTFPSSTRVSHVSMDAAPRIATPFEMVCTCRPSGHGVYPDVAYPHNAYFNLRRIGSTSIRGRTAVVFRVLTADGSAMQQHTVVMWSRGGHTYALGFHGLDPAAAPLDIAVADAIKYVAG